MELRVLSHLADLSVARDDITLGDFVQVFVELLADLELRTDVSSKRLVMLLDVDVDDVLVVELPCQSQVVGAFGTGAEVVLSVILLAQQLNRLH